MKIINKEVHDVCALITIEIKIKDFFTNEKTPKRIVIDFMDSGLLDNFKIKNIEVKEHKCHLLEVDDDDDFWNDDEDENM